MSDEPRRRRRFLARPSIPIDVLNELDPEEDGTLEPPETLAATPSPKPKLEVIDR